MPDSLRPCLKCDYLLPGDAGQTRCPECGEVNNFVEMDSKITAALESRVRTLFPGRFFSGEWSRMLWRARLPKSLKLSRLAFVALLAGCVLPMLALIVSATFELRTTVQCTPNPVKRSTVIGEPTPCKLYHRPAFVETHWYRWNGWGHANHQNGAWARLAFHPLGEQVDRVLLSRSITLSSLWSSPRYVIEDLVLILLTVASWWALAAFWIAWTNRVTQRDWPADAAQNAFKINGRFICALVLTWSGILLTIIVAAELVIRLTIPEYAVAGRGAAWYSVKAYLPWSVAVPAGLFWLLSTKGPPGVARSARWVALSIVAVGVIAKRLLARVKLPQVLTKPVPRGMTASR